MATRLLEPGCVDIEAIKDAHPLVSVVEPRVRLKRAGNTMVGLCPFHTERTPSFYCYQDQRYHCFGCGEHGDVFDFLEKLDGLDLRQAAEKITGGTYPTYTPDRIEELRAKRLAFEAEERNRREVAIQAARERWMAASPDFDGHPYLAAKGINRNGAKLDGDGNLLVPLYCADDGKIQSIQTIDATGRKLFLADAPVSEGFFVIGGKVATTDRPVLLCEGFATAASLHEATGNIVVCAFNSGNLTKVADKLAAKYPTRAYIVCGDDDRGRDRNPGREAAFKAAATLKCRAMFPVFPEDSDGTDFNDMAAIYGKEAVKALVEDGELPSGEAAAVDFGTVYQTLSLDELEDLPAPTYLIDRLIPEHGLTILYGDPGSCKSFIAIDASLRLAYSMNWHGTKAKKVGVLYIAGEGKHGLGKRIKGWRREHGMEGVDAAFKLLPVAVHLLDPENVETLKRTIMAVQHELSFNIGLVIIDTVSRSIAGQDENKQDTMSLFVDACADLQTFTGGAVIGIHHGGKDRDRGMRGSSVLLGACDAVIRTEKNDQGVVTLRIEKQKDDEESVPIHMEMKKIEWGAGLEEPVSTLVPIKSEAPVQKQTELTNGQAYECLKEIDRRWSAGRPFSASTNAPERFLGGYIQREYHIPRDAVTRQMQAWFDAEMLASEQVDKKSKMVGLRVLKWPE